LLLPLFVCPGLAFAEVITGASETEVRDWVIGRSSAELKILFGSPDGRTNKRGKGSETWRYGKSSIFFQNGQAVAYIDQGELRLRKFARPWAERKLRKARDFSLEGWTNPWTKSEISEIKVIESMMSEEKISSEKVSTEKVSTEKVSTEESPVLP